MKQLFKSCATLVGFMAIIIGCIINSNQATAKAYNLNDNYQGGSCSVVISGNNLYYAVTETGKIRCYNIKTKKTKTFVSKKGNGFYQLKKKGNYLYAVFDSYMGSDGSNESIVRISLKNKKVTTLAKGCNYIIKKNKIYYTKTKRTKIAADYAYDEPVGVYSMTLSGKKKKKASGVELVNNEQSTIKSSKGTLFTTGKTYSSDYYSPKALHFKNKKGKTTTIYDIEKDKKAYENSSISYYTLQGNYIVYKKYIKSKKYGATGQLVLVKTNGKGAKIFYSCPSVSGW